MAGVSPAQRRALRARAHALRPVVLIGDGGVSDSVVAEIERALAAHELIKVRAGGMERGARELAMAAICERTGAEPVQAIGKVMVLWRENPDQPQRVAPAAPAAPRPGSATRSARPRSRTSSR